MERISKIYSDELRGYFYRINNALTEAQFWMTVFTNEERNRIEASTELKEKLRTEYGMFEVYCIIRQKSINAAVITLSHDLGLMPEGIRKRLAREIHTEGSTKAPIFNDRPTWMRATGNLFWGKRLIRRIRLGVATNLPIILDSFQELEWPERINDPMPGPANNQRLHEAIKSLNRGLLQIRFTQMVKAKVSYGRK
ncbi:MAG: hypothetical protein QM811_19925 [Pirellulales bacterium]